MKGFIFSCKHLVSKMVMTVYKTTIIEPDYFVEGINEVQGGSWLHLLL